jgi:phage gp29-like protein
MVRKSNLWRDNYNPLRSLTIQRVIALIEAAERGDMVEIQLVIRKACRRYPILKGFLEKLLSSIEELDWDIKVMDPLPEGATDAMAEAQQKFLRSRYDLLTNLTEAIGQLARADVRGFTILHKRFYTQDGTEAGKRNDGAVKELYWTEPWCWSRDGSFGDWFYNPTSRMGIGIGSCTSSLGEANRLGGESLARENFVVREVEEPLYEIALIALVNWLLGRKDWAGFVEIFGLPNGVVIMPPNIPTGKESEYQSAAEKVADGVSGALPAQSDIKFPTASIRQNSPFSEWCNAQDKDVVLAGTGGQLTMLAADVGGLGSGPSAEHADAWTNIAAAKARKINEVLQRDFDAVELAAEFPSQPVCVYFELAAQDEEDVGALCDNAVKLKNAGKVMDTEWLEEKTGYELEDAPEPQPNPFSFPPGGNLPKYPGQRPAQPDPNNPGEPPSSSAKATEDGKGGTPNEDPAAAALRNRSALDPRPSTLDQFAAAVASDLAPVSERLQRIMAIQDPEIFKARLTAFLAELDQLKADLVADPASARVLEQLNATALAAGLTGKTNSQLPTPISQLP